MTNLKRRMQHKRLQGLCTKIYIVYMGLLFPGHSVGTSQPLSREVNDVKFEHFSCLDNTSCRRW